MIAVIIKSSLSLIILFGLYWILLKNEKIFVFNRFFLIASLVFSMAIPFVSIPVSFRATQELNRLIPVNNYFEVPVINETEMFDQGTGTVQNISQKEITGVRTRDFLVVLYLSGVVFFLIRFILNLSRIISRKKNYERIVLEGYDVILTDERAGPYCFFKTIFLNREEYLNGRIDREVLSHEQEHARQSHSLDIVIVELFKIFYWFNPVYMLYDKAIRINHEYLADNVVINSNADTLTYAQKLIGFISGRGNLSMTSGSGSNFVRERLLMMVKTRRGRLNRGIRITVSMIATMLFLLCLSFRESEPESPVSDQPVKETIVTQNSVRGTILSEDGRPLFGATVRAPGLQMESVEVIAGFDGEFLMEEIRPDATIVINYRGFREQQIKADFSKPMVVRLVRDPEYKGRVFITEVQYVNFRNTDFTPAQAVISVDGVILAEGSSLNLGTGSIKTLKILASGAAIDKYGAKGSNGAVEISLFRSQAVAAVKETNDNTVPDSSRYITGFSVNHKPNRGEPIDIPVSALQSVSIWYNHDLDKTDRKERRTVSIMTRDYYKVKGRVTRENGKALPGVKISATDNPLTVVSDRDGHFAIEDVREGALIEFSHPGYESYYLSTLYEVAFNEDMNITLRKKGSNKNEELSAIPGRASVAREEKSEMPNFSNNNSRLSFTTGLSASSTAKILKFLATNTSYPQEARNSSDTGRISVNVRIGKGGVVKECMATSGVSATNVPHLPEIVIVGYGEQKDGLVRGKETLKNYGLLKSECLRTVNMLGEISVSEWQSADMEFSVSFKFILKENRSSFTFSSNSNVSYPYTLRRQK